MAGTGALTGTYKPDGNNISPLGSAATFNVNGGSQTLDAAFGGMSPNGTWTLYFADVVAGGSFVRFCLARRRSITVG